MLDLIAADIPRARVIDLFAGSGALGLEALSRGATTADFVENGAASLHALKANVAAFKLKRRARIFKRDVIPFVEQIDKVAYDVAFMDPPYGSRKLERVLNRWLEIPFSRLLCIEHGRDHRLPRRGKRYDFGDTRVTIFRIRSDTSPTGASSQS
jgi:16S rRNA (guanine966-N2)-methyltransferase